MSKRASGHHNHQNEDNWRSILSSALDETWCPSLQEAIEKLPLDELDRHLVFEQLHHFRAKLLLPVLKKGSAELRAYHDDHPDFLAAIHSFTLDQPCLFELVSQQYLNNPSARQADGEVSDGLSKVLPYVKLLLKALRSLPEEFHYKGQVFRFLPERHDNLAKRFNPGRFFFRYAFNCTRSREAASRAAANIITAGGTVWQTLDAAN
ncbi:unnamed protein product, partial [Effrenium voratum]